MRTIGSRILIRISSPSPQTTNLNNTQKPPDLISAKGVYEMAFAYQHGEANFLGNELALADLKLVPEQAYIGGEWVSAKSKKTYVVTNPATGATIAPMPDMDAIDTRLAIEAAHGAFPAWQARAAKERAAILRRWFDLILVNQEDLARILTAEQGKPLAESRGEIA